MLQNCRNAMTRNAELYVLEMVLSCVGTDDPVVAMLDLNMLAALHGRERSLA
ncbi:methyltransferase [Bradyrhizobium sp.]|uniref:methyltransferase n=1 Tax=Bradyrhizobium sp. TaxID=376 RepID=UPI003C364B72